MPAADDTVRHDNERRVARMRVWINLAETLPAGEDHAHVRFVMYWISYEAAYQVYKVGRGLVPINRTARFSIAE